jgi:uncharacterized SAM-binding protein YcdF (DUF218 family)
LRSSLAKRLRKGVLLALAGLGLLVVCVTLSPILRWWAQALAGPWHDPHGEILIVLAGDSPGGDLIGRSSYWRAIYAVLLWRRGGVQRIFISGGGEQGEPPVSAVMKNLLVCSGVPADVIEIETDSHTTRENARQTLRRLGRLPASKVLLTSDYHMYRAWRVFRRTGLEVLPHPVPDALKQSTSLEERWSVFVRLLVETAKIAYYKLRGWM